MDIQKLRQDRGWSQEQLAEIADISARTIQRIEKGQPASPDTLKALAAVFEITLKDLQATDKSATTAKRRLLNAEERRILREIRAQRAFYIHLFFYLSICAFLFIINFITWHDYLWAMWPSLGWGLAIVIHGMTIVRPLGNLGAEWERREFKKRLQERRQ